MIHFRWQKEIEWKKYSGKIFFKREEERKEKYKQKECKLQGSSLGSWVSVDHHVNPPLRTLNFDYQTWAMGKEFHVGDKLIFKYKQGNHNMWMNLDSSNVQQQPH
ncbi:hypothetical protein LIER_43190 [Lithospermum erythrorhizon]|uniref:Phytocyanin domain-containing protein n=1 Tax=Lithospermum erythrorhizon TaxID=34254 RepID=A0AAV3PLR0_LITER